MRAWTIAAVIIAAAILIAGALWTSTGIGIYAAVYTAGVLVGVTLFLYERWKKWWRS
jgi:hypothetical protein